MLWIRRVAVGAAGVARPARIDHAPDAANVADLVGQGRCLYDDVPEESLRELRGLLAAPGDPAVMGLMARALLALEALQEALGAIGRPRSLWRRLLGR